MLFRLVYLFMVRLFGWLALLARSDTSRDVEISRVALAVRSPSGWYQGTTFQATSRARQAGLVAHAEEIRSRVVVVVGGDEPGAARGCGPPAGVFEQEQYESAGAGSVWVEPRRGVRVAPGVDLLDQIVQRRHVAIVDPPLLVRDDISEAVRLRLEEPRIGGHWYSMAKVAATREGAESANITGPSVICLASQRQ